MLRILQEKWFSKELYPIHGKNSEDLECSDEIYLNLFVTNSNNPITCHISTVQLKFTILYIKLKRKRQISKSVRRRQPAVSKRTAMGGNKISGALEEFEQRKSPMLKKDCLILRIISLALIE